VGNYALPRITAPGWHDRAACISEDVDLFFPVAPADEIAAKAICAGCPVRAKCLDYATAHALLGIWGGTTEDERRNTRRRELRAARRTAAA
jgi:WhiB family transcriptional regulator, redox-sensing transcriptional regulator